MREAVWGGGDQQEIDEVGGGESTTVNRKMP